MMLHWERRRASKAYAAATLIVLLWVQGSTFAKDGPIRSLSSTEKTAALGGSLGMGIIAKLIPGRHADSAEYTGYRANSLDRWWRTTLHGGDGHKTNFIDNSRGSLVAPVAGGIAIALVDINRREFSRDIPFFVAGAVATGAFTDIGKRVFQRPRPYCQTGGVRPPERSANDSYHTESFFSGHSSQAFFAAGFVNNRLRRHMRQEWRRDEYRSWRWASPLITYGWATFVAGSRIQADKHHFTDVLTGAVVGYGIGELFYRMCYEPGQTESGTPSGMNRMFSLALTF
jgi:membrane-associated phospholipid phosphatase